MTADIHDSPAADIMRDLYKEIEHLMDAPFRSITPKDQSLDVSAVTTSHSETGKFQDQITDTLPTRSLALSTTDLLPQDLSNEDDVNYDRPILIESDSDDIEEGLLTPDQQQYSFLTCYKCNRIIPFDPIASSNNRLAIPTEESIEEAANICSECASAKKKRRSRSRSFTGGVNVLSVVAEKVKRSLSGNSTQYRLGNNSGETGMLSPTAVSSSSRRKSMPHMCAASQQSVKSLEPPTSPISSRPSSRASSIIEDFKHLLSPLSRKSSRNSAIYDDSNIDSQALSGSNTPTEKSSRSSIFDAFSVHKSKQKSSSSPYERRLVRPYSDDSENNSNLESTSLVNELDPNKCIHIPLRRKQIKQIASRQDRIDLYNNAYYDCMQSETDLISWIIKQTQKGPPDAWFGYTPPPKEPKRILGIFKRRSTAAKNSGAEQQMRLGEDLLSRSTPLLQRHLSNSSLSHLSTSPAAQSYMSYQQDTSNSHKTPETLAADEEPTGYFSDVVQQGQQTVDYSDRYPSAQEPIATAIQPVSILKKPRSNSRASYIAQEESYDFFYEDVTDMDDLDDVSIYNNDAHIAYENTAYQHNVHKRSNNSLDHGRRRKLELMIDDDYQQASVQSPSHEGRFQESNANGYIRHGKREEGYNSSSYNDLKDGSEQDNYFYTDQYASPSSEQLRQSASRSSSRRASILRRPQQKISSYSENVRYGTGTCNDSRARRSSYFLEEWEYNLDGLCDLFPRFDRDYLNDFLEAAEGDFVTAKRMILDMVMKSTRA